MNNQRVKLQIYKTIERYIKEHGYAPSLNEISKKTYIRSKKTIREYIQKIIEDGDLETDHPGEDRALRLPERSRKRSAWYE